MPCPYNHVIIFIVIKQFGCNANVFVGVVDASVEQPLVLCANREQLSIFNCVEEDVVGEDMRLVGLKKRLPAALKALKEIGAAKSHKTLARTGEVLQHLGFSLSWRL